MSLTCVNSEIINSLSYYDSLSIKETSFVVNLMGPTAKTMQEPHEIEWMMRDAPRKIVDEYIIPTIIQHEMLFGVSISNIVLISQGDKKTDKKVENCNESGIATTIQAIYDILLYKCKDVKIWIYSISAKTFEDCAKIFPKCKILGSTNREFPLTEDVEYKWPGISALRSAEHAGKHYAAQFASNLNIRVWTNKPISPRSLTYYGDGEIIYMQ